MWGTNFDQSAHVLIGKRSEASEPFPGLEKDGEIKSVPKQRTYSCGNKGSFRILTEKSNPEVLPCIKPPHKCSGGTRNGLPCVGDQNIGHTCPSGGVCLPDWCDTPAWWQARKKLADFPNHCKDLQAQTCPGGTGEVACDPCPLQCKPNWYTKYESSLKICSVEELQCELIAEGGRFNVMVELAGQESNWTDCSDAVIDCAKRTCGTVCANGPNAGMLCDGSGSDKICQGGTENDGTKCPSGPSQCGSLLTGKCDVQCPIGACPPGKTCTGEPGACVSEESYCDQNDPLIQYQCARGCFEFRGRALMIIFDKNREPSASVLSGNPLVKQPHIALIDDLGKKVIEPSIYATWDSNVKTGESVKVEVERIDMPASAGGTLNP